MAEATDVVNEWGGLEVKLPPFITETTTQVNNVLSVVSASLDVVSSILNVARAFAVSPLDPTRVLLDAILDFIQSYLRDLRQAGVYYAGDHRLITGTLTNVRGGYGAYETRMLNRLLDQNDPNRPNFSPQTGVLAIFFYASGDISQAERLVDFIRSISRFFGQLGSSGLPVPTGLASTMGSQGTSITNLRSMFPSRFRPGSIPTDVTLTWSLDPADAFPPSGFLVEVSTLPNGLFVAYSAPTPSGTGGAQSGTQQRVQGLYVHGETLEPLRIYGGIDSVADEAGYNSFLESGSIRPGSAVSFALKSPTDLGVIPFSEMRRLRDGGKYLYQRTFFVGGTAATYFTGGQFSITIPKSEFPWNGDVKKQTDGQWVVDDTTLTQASSVYVRVYACNSKVTSPTSYRWKIAPRVAAGDERCFPIVEGGSGIVIASRGEPSAPMTLTVPNVTTVDFLNCVRTALAVLILSRSDLTRVGVPTQTTVSRASQADLIARSRGNQRGNTQAVESSDAPSPQVTYATGLETIASRILPRMFAGGDVASYLQDTRTAASFRHDLMVRIDSMAREILNAQGTVPESYLAQRINQFKRILDWKWSQTTANIELRRSLPNTTVLESLMDEDSLTGPNQNFNCLGSLGVDQSQRYRVGVFTTGTQSLPDPVVSRMNAAGIIDTAEYLRTPLLVLTDSGDEVVPMGRPQDVRGALACRQVLDPGVIALARGILSVTTTEERAPGDWTSVRFFPTGVPALEGVLTEVETFVQGLSDGTRGATHLLDQFIDFYQQRVRELQGLQQRIRSLINQMDLLVEIPTGQVLITASSGTDGVVGDFLGASNKPSDGPDSFGVGSVALFGGLPSFVQDLLISLLRGAS
jgi:hypothetical protein